MKKTAISKSYATALFSVACKENKIENILKDLEKIEEKFIVYFSSELNRYSISKSSLQNIINNISRKMSLDPIFSRFLILLCKNKRLFLLNDIRLLFNSFVKKKNNILEVDVISSNSLDKNILETISKYLSKNNDSKKIEINQVINHNILGGFQIKTGSNLIDYSLKNQIFKMHNHLIALVK